MKSTKRPPLLLLLFLLLFISLLPSAAPADANPTDAAALSALKSSLGGRWNTTASNACNWQGVECSSQGRVLELHLPGVGFVGSIPDFVLGNLSSLTFLSLRYNALTGTIPSDFSKLSNLKFLYLQHNRLSGPIPEVLFSVRNLTRLDLSGNRFSGEIPMGFNNLSKLATLLLQNNQLTGSIPDLKVNNLNQFNVSHNLLTGNIPSQFCGMPSTAFEGNSLTPCANTEPSPSPNGDIDVDKNGHKKKNKLSAGALAGIIIGSVIALLAILLLIFLCCCKRNKKNEQQNATRSLDSATIPASGGAVGATKRSDIETGRESTTIATNGESSSAASAAKSGGKSGSGIDKTLVFFGKGPRVFDLDELLRASAEVLGKGNYGTTYKAALDNGVAVAVKRLKDVTATEKEFKEKMEEIGKIEHENIVSLRAYHCSANEKLLVYDYFPMGSLSALLHGNRGSGRTPLNWEARSAIALGAARGITYIHSLKSTSSHGNIKSSNILLSNSYEARVSDCGLAQLATPSPSSAPNRIAGYRAPEITDSRRVSQKADVYSFGVFLLELLTGKAPTHALLNEEGVDLPRWVQSVVREEWAAEVFDMELLRYQNVEEDMVKLLQLAIDCTAQYPDSRPSMADVTSYIEEICKSNSTSRQDPLADITSDLEITSSTPS
ncbi:unnamed protein product [Amaranthus hypochondriacus]